MTYDVIAVNVVTDDVVTILRGLVVRTDNLRVLHLGEILLRRESECCRVEEVLVRWRQ